MFKGCGTVFWTIVYLRLFFSFDEFLFGGTGIWRLNTSLLENPGVREMIVARIKAWKDLIPIFGTVREWWEEVKVRLEEAFQRIARRASDRASKSFKAKSACLQRLC